ncbi:MULTISPECIES: diphthine synthase [Acidianus]|uniref:Diphthine synthase n=1 Tax=Candidatus Acidianus copahuensis TaxID=1160895 RepID=A0A031LNY7_9CREN|nr:MULTISPECIES: diphthine synthase [Acidianus]EZQ06797.1 diphthine synthase [Candidatus Acidianus copahuensis]NON61807.1 diphthine synthase [Acidianus sp. RZ1]
MGDLYLIGLGLSKRFLTNASIESMKRSDVIFLDSYTSLSCDLSKDVLEEIIGKQISIVKREDLEQGYRNIIESLKTKNVAIATVGDPMIATTHVGLAVEARKNGYNVRIVPGISVHCYIISKSMLSSYKFGRSVTLVYPYEGKTDMTTYNVIKSNQEAGLHSIIYLDLRDGKPMDGNEAINLLLSMESQRNEGVIRLDDVLVLGERLGCDEERVFALSFREAIKVNLNRPPYIIIIPSKKLHYMEVEALKCLH